MSSRMSKGLERVLLDEVNRLNETGDLDGLAASYAKYEKTKEVLSLCDELFVKRICICTTHPSIRVSETFPFGSDRSLFCEGETKCWDMKAWKIAKDSGIWTGCGNGNQAQIDPSLLIHGFFEKGVDGEWYGSLT